VRSEGLGLNDFPRCKLNVPGRIPGTVPTLGRFLRLCKNDWPKKFQGVGWPTSGDNLAPSSQLPLQTFSLSCSLKKHLEGFRKTRIPKAQLGFLDHAGFFFVEFRSMLPQTTTTSFLLPLPLSPSPPTQYQPRMIEPICP